jgi:exosortase E/protease (VPEID-CTERM system)
MTIDRSRSSSAPSVESGLLRSVGSLRLVRRLGLFVALAACEVFLISFLFNFPVALPEWSNPVAYANKLARMGLIAAAAFVLILYPSRGRFLEAWSRALNEPSVGRRLLLNLGLFASLLSATIAFSEFAAASPSPPWGWFAAYCVLLVLTGISLLHLIAPAFFLGFLLKTARPEIALAIGSACLVVGIGELSQESWSVFGLITLKVAHGVLGLYEHNIVMDVDQRLLGVGDFRVFILEECSGYEGIGLIVTFLALYLWIFRRDLRFPNALLLFPVGIATIWALNAVRIAALISIGAHISPVVAVDGFHSQAGWISFLLVTFGVIAASRRLRFFRAQPAAQSALAFRGDERLLLALLAPFMAFMAASVISAAFKPNDQWLYLLKVVGISAALWFFRGQYSFLLRKVSGLSVLAGIAVGILWIATQRSNEEGAALATWLAELPASLVALWIAMRAIGTTLLVPVAEELAFRGYLHRVLISRRFETVEPGQFAPLAFVLSSLLFGLMHERWLAATLSGAAFALIMYRSNRLSDPIAAHMTANGVIALWVITMGEWSLL